MNDTTRRRALQILTVGGLTTTILIPSKWIKPVVEAIVIPAHAQASPRTAPSGTTRTTGTTTGTSTSTTTQSNW